jgi:hypothetical protein
MISGLVKMETVFPLKRNVTKFLIAMMALMNLTVKRYVDYQGMAEGLKI